MESGSGFNISMVHFKDEVQMLEEGWKVMWKLSQLWEDMYLLPLDCVIFLLFLEYLHLVCGNPHLLLYSHIVLP